MRKVMCVGVLLATASTTNAGPPAAIFGAPTDIPVPRDFDGDGRADFAVWRPSTGMWWSLSSAPPHAVRSEQLGASGDIPVPADYTGDGRTDFAVFRPDGTWSVEDGVTGAALPPVQLGYAGDIPVPGDYSGDGRIDYAIWWPSAGMWWVQDGVTGAQRVVVLGQSGDVPMPGDYDGVRGDDFAVWRPSTGQWLTLGGTTNIAGPPLFWGRSGDTPLNARFCSDTASPTFWRPEMVALFQTFGPAQATLRVGARGDVALAANFAGDSVDDYAVFRPSTGEWFVEQSPCDRFAPVRVKVDAALGVTRGIAVAAVKHGRIVLAYGAGMANATAPATPDTPWQLASVSKLFIGTAALILADDGLLSLDGFAGIHNPYTPWTHPWAVLTPRHFASHTSGVNGCEFPGWDPTMEPVANLVTTTSCLSDSRAASSWLPVLPGMTGWYSNLGAAWNALLVEDRGGVDFDTFTRDRIFNPLGMTRTAWFGNQLAGPLAVGYFNRVTPSPEYGVMPYPSGNLRASARDVAKFLIMWTSGGVAENGTRILNASTVADALTLRQSETISPYGFTWARGKTDDGARTAWGHGGALAAVCTRVNIDPVERDGFVMLLNGPCADVGNTMSTIENRAFRVLDEQ